MSRNPTNHQHEFKKIFLKSLISPSNSTLRQVWKLSVGHFISGLSYLVYWGNLGKFDVNTSSHEDECTKNNP